MNNVAYRGSFSDCQRYVARLRQVIIKLAPRVSSVTWSMTYPSHCLGLDRRGERAVFNECDLLLVNLDHSPSKRIDALWEEIRAGILALSAENMPFLQVVS